MMTRSVSGVFPVFQVGFLNLTQLQPTVFAGFRTRVSGVSGFTRVQACARAESMTLHQHFICFFMREEQPNTPDTPDTVAFKHCFIRVFGVLGLCQVYGFVCRVRFFGGIAR